MTAPLPVPRYATTAAGRAYHNIVPNNDVGQALLALEGPASTEDEMRELLLETSVQSPNSEGAHQHTQMAGQLSQLISQLLFMNFITKVEPHYTLPPESGPLP